MYYKKTTAFWSGNDVKKIIYEVRKISSKGELLYESILEYDAFVRTDNREMIIPKTSRGKMKRVNSTNLLSVKEAGCSFILWRDIYNSHETFSMSVYNTINNKELPLYGGTKGYTVSNDEDFHVFMEQFVKTCPPDYFDRVRLIREAKHINVKYKVGDIFRMEISRFEYHYGIIIGKVGEFYGWDELPDRHSFNTLLTVPIMIRLYDITTTEKNLKAEDLKDIRLGRMEICSDGEIFRGTHTIVDHKDIDENDLEFNLICSKTNGFGPHDTTTTFDSLIHDKIVETPDRFDLFVEWGMATTILRYENMTEKLREFMKDYFPPHGGVTLGISTFAGLCEKDNLLDSNNDDIREELFCCLGLEKDADFDDFALKFGGMKKSDIINKMVM